MGIGFPFKLKVYNPAYYVGCWVENKTISQLDVYPPKRKT